MVILTEKKKFPLNYPFNQHSVHALSVPFSRYRRGQNTDRTLSRAAPSDYPPPPNTQTLGEPEPGRKGTVFYLSKQTVWGNLIVMIRRKDASEAKSCYLKFSR